MLPFLGSMAITIAAVTTPSVPLPQLVAQTTPVTAPASASATARRHGRQQQAVSVEPSGPSADELAIEQQRELRVLMPVLSGDGGG